MIPVTIIIAAHNEENSINDCLQSLMDMDYNLSLLQIIVIDNCSTDRTKEIVLSFPVYYIYEQRKGVSYARNTGIAHALYPIIVFLDADTVVKKDWLQKIIIPFDDNTISAVGGKILPKKETLVSRYLGYSLFGRYRRSDKIRREKTYITCNLAVRREFVRHGFNPDFPISEDLDFTHRITDQGNVLIYYPNAVVYHEHPAGLKPLFSYWLKSAKGRIFYCNLYKVNKTCLIMKYQIFTFLFLSAIPMIFFAPHILAVIIVLLYCSLVIRVLKEKPADQPRPFSFIFVPLMDFISLFFMSFAFGFYRYIRRIHVSFKKNRF